MFSVQYTLYRVLCTVCGVCHEQCSKGHLPPTRAGTSCHTLCRAAACSGGCWAPRLLAPGGLGSGWCRICYTILVIEMLYVILFSGVLGTTLTALALEGLGRGKGRTQYNAGLPSRDILCGHCDAVENCGILW